MMNKNHRVSTTILQDDSMTFPGKPDNSVSGQLRPQCWLDDECMVDMDNFVKALAGIKSKGVRPDLVGSVITHYASKWLPDLSPSPSAAATSADPTTPEPNPPASPHSLSESATVSWMKKRFFVETLVGVLPAEKDAVACDFLLRLLRTANMVAADPPYRAELERRVAWQLDQASLRELMIPSFSHTCGTLLDVDLVLRLVKRFLSLDDVSKSGLGVVKVAKLVDSYLAEAAVDGGLSMAEFVELAGALPCHARAVDDGLYRAIDTYLKAHPNTSKQERKRLCRLIDSRKLSPEASLHAAQNERLPVRAVIQVLFSEHSKLSRNLSDWSGSFTASASARSPEHHQRCLSRREQAETRRLREDVVRLQGQFKAMQAQMDRVVSLLDHKYFKKNNKHQQQQHGGESRSSSSSSSFGLFRWKSKLGFIVPRSFKSGVIGNSNKMMDHHYHYHRHDQIGFERHNNNTTTPTNSSGNMRTKIDKSAR